MSRLHQEILCVSVLPIIRAYVFPYWFLTHDASSYAGHVVLCILMHQLYRYQYKYIYEALMHSSIRDLIKYL